MATKKMADECCAKCCDQKALKRRGYDIMSGPQPKTTPAMSRKAMTTPQLGLKLGYGK